MPSFYYLSIIQHTSKRSMTCILNMYITGRELHKHEIDKKGWYILHYSDVNYRMALEMHNVINKCGIARDNGLVDYRKCFNWIC